LGALVAFGSVITLIRAPWGRRPRLLRRRHPDDVRRGNLRPAADVGRRGADAGSCGSRGGELARGLGADGAVQRVGHEQQAFGCRAVALSVPQRQLVRRQQRPYVVLAVAPDRARPGGRASPSSESRRGRQTRPRAFAGRGSCRRPRWEQPIGAASRPCAGWTRAVPGSTTAACRAPRTTSPTRPPGRTTRIALKFGGERGKDLPRLLVAGRVGRLGNPGLGLFQRVQDAQASPGPQSPEGGKSRYPRPCRRSSAGIDPAIERDVDRSLHAAGFRRQKDGSRSGWLLRLE